MDVGTFVENGEDAAAAGSASPRPQAPPGSEQDRVDSQLAARTAQWQCLVDDLKLQLHLGSREIRDRVAPFLKELDQALRDATTALRRLGESDESERPVLRVWLEHALQELGKSFEQVRQTSEQRDD